MRTLLWFRGKDLRVADHAPLLEAARGELIPIFVLDPYFFAPERARKLPHRLQFLLESLQALRANLEHLGTRLVLATGKSVSVVPELAARFRVDRVLAHRWSEPFGQERDRRVAAALAVPFELFEGETLAAPGSLLTEGGTPFSVYTPFARAFRARVNVSSPLAAPVRLPPLPEEVAAAAPREELPTLESLGIARNPRLLPGGERAGRERLAAFLAGPLESYDTARERLDLEGTSRLSADLKFGTLSARTVYNATVNSSAREAAVEKFRAELLWREFTHHTLAQRPELLSQPFRPDFSGFPWRDDDASWHAWREGRTGFPIVDAAARQLLAEGFVHNRARMIAASFLTKQLLISYQRGEAHYLELLTDGDYAQNNAGWQWSAGCGCDAQPYFRIFNPTVQAKRYDPAREYVRRWLPELDTPGYPKPIVDHAQARVRFLQVAATHLRAARLRSGTTRPPR
ncbi:MAG TPA: deoxyribodipyrimidine photo-lyase [Polyangiaceae bacterium]|nr:deoxyribodipyrimidine photo-lyase [Polyangiaceae bacterium]